MTTGKTLVDKIWQSHRVVELEESVDLLYVDRVVLHERSGGRMLDGVLQAGRRVADPDSVFATIDHIVDTDQGRGDQTKFPGGEEFISFFRDNASTSGVEMFDISDRRQGIVHVMAPELGIAQPGLTMVCGDSHTPTLGGIGALAWGIGVTQGEHALTTHCLPVKKPRQMRINLEGSIPSGVSAKDIILHVIGREGATGGKGYAIEFSGNAVREMSAQARMTLCNMAVEFGGWTAIVAPDEQVFEFLKGTEYAPTDEHWDAAKEHWKTLYSDESAKFDLEVTIDVSRLEPHISWGTSSDQVVALNGQLPDPAIAEDPIHKASMEKAMQYMELKSGQSMLGLPIDVAFIGSCTNSRLEDLRTAAAVIKGKKVSTGTKAWCVPGSTEVKRQAEAEGLDRIFIDAGFEWRESGCSLCFFAGGDNFGDAKRVISTTNRNFQNRQGPGVQTHLASPATVAASAISGCVADPRVLLGEAH